MHIDIASDWKAIDKLVDDQKFEEASKAVAAVREKCKSANDEEQWAKALIKEVELRSALGGYETAVRFLRTEPWPEGTVPHLALELYYAWSLTSYINNYSWEISQRERVDSKGAVDLKAWTKDQIAAEAVKAYAEVWARRAELSTVSIDSFAEYLDVNDYPRPIRGTLRDAVSYLAVNLLADTSLWRPEAQSELRELDFKALLAGGSPTAQSTRLDDATLHPLARALAVLDDLEQWHAQGDQVEASLEARLERERRLSGSFTDATERAAIRKDLDTRLPKSRSLAWWSMGMATLAEMTRDSGDHVEARRIALEGADAFPKSVGGERCLHIARSIEAPDYGVQTMSSDGTGKRSIAVTHRNLPTLWFRAYPVDLVERIKAANDYNLLPAYQELAKIVRDQKPAASWEVALPTTPDYLSHRTFVTPPMTKPGLYVIAASADKDFSWSRNRIVATNLIVGDLVLETREDAPGNFVITALSGATGRPVSGADISLWQYDWRTHHQKVDGKKSDAAGEVRFSGRGNDHSYLVTGEHQGQVALDADHLYFGAPPHDSLQQASFVYTDRSIYRPEQTLHWKVVAYRGQSAKYQLATGMDIQVVLRDANYQDVIRKKVTTNQYGSASGEFLIPAGRLLGQWQVQVEGAGGSTMVRVEEYKRPTFEVTLKDADKPLRLNEPADLSGEARYYFGLPVTHGDVKWRITREPVYPWWYWYWYSGGAARTETIATGRATVDEKGLFHVKFTPAADERKAKDKGVSYSYRVAADFTDEGGETRSASRSFRLGFVSVEARIEASAGFYLEGKPVELAITRTNLDGAPRAGKGSWKLVALTQPEHALLPADEPVTLAPDSDEDHDSGKNASAKKFHTAGDLLRARWESGYRPQASIAQWKDGAEHGHGELTHDAEGKATVTLPALAPGAWRVRYTTVDDFGATFDTWHDLLVAARTGKKTPLALPAILLAEKTSVTVGGTARFLALSSLPDQILFFDIFQGGLLKERRRLTAASGGLVEIPITEADRGGFSVRIATLRDHQHLTSSESLFVPWDDKELALSFSTFRDLLKPGQKETWRVTLKSTATSGAKVDNAAQELLAYMYDRSLDVFAPHNPPSPLSLYPSRTSAGWVRASLGSAGGQQISTTDWYSLPGYPQLTGDRLKFENGYGIGGMGLRAYGSIGRGGGGPMRMEGGMGMPPPSPGAPPAKAAAAPMARRAKGSADKAEESDGAPPPPPEAQAATTTPAAAVAPAPAVTLRTNFSETAFWQPNLITDGKGEAAIEFTVPDSVTSWNVWVHAISKDLRAGSLHKEVKTVKDLLVRPYLPRFFREGDSAELKVVVNNASKKPLDGKLTFDIIDPDTKESLLKAFGLTDNVRPFHVDAGGGTNLGFPVIAPRRIGTVAFKVTATAGDTSDGELRPLPILPSRVHLVQSRFATLHDKDKRTLKFADLERTDDASRENEQLVVTLDAQLFYTVLQALPYLIDYPYECAEQTMNRFLSSGIMTSLFSQYPAVGKMATEMAKRDTRLEQWDASDPNRKMALEEAPWLQEAKGGADVGLPLIKVLDPRIAKANRDSALAKLAKSQTSAGGWSWFPGGPPSPYITLYLEYGFAKAAEFNVEVPRDMVAKGWQYLAQHLRSDYLQRMREDKADWEWLTFLNYVAGSYPDGSWTQGGLSDDERKEVLAYSFKHWKQHSPYLKGLLALTLHRMDRHADALLVFASVMDSAKTVEDQGTFWQPEDRSWLWYNDTIESHAFALRVMMELTPEDKRQDGLVLWLLLNKKLNHWKSTRATAEVIYSLAKYMKKDGSLAVREEANVSVGEIKKTYTFEPDKYVGKTQLIVAGKDVSAKTASVTVEKSTKGVMFASATWHFSTEQLPKEASGDFFSVTRAYFKRENTGKEWVVKPLTEGATLSPGDEVEVQLSLRAKQSAEYVHLRDPRAAGLEPDTTVSQWKWDLGIAWYEEVRDSGTNFFFEALPAGEYTFKYRVRANVAGKFRVGPATVQSLYAPEFAAYSAGNLITVVPGTK